MEQVTIRDIARKCKVGVSTVSRAMNNHPDINPETKEMILKVIAESNYVPNNSARNLKRSNAKAIAILVKGMDNMFFNNMISVIEEVVRKKKYACIIERVEEKANEVDSAIEIVKEKRLRGIIFLGGNFTHPHEKMAQIPVPYVISTIGAVSDGGKPCASVSVDDYRESYKMVDYLCGLGHRRIAIITACEDDISIGRLRLNAYRQALLDHGIPYDPDLVFHMTKDDTYSFATGYKVTKEILEKKTEFSYPWINLEQCAAEENVMLLPGSLFRKMADEVYAKAEAEPNIVYQISGTRTGLACVAYNHGVMITLDHMIFNNVFAEQILPLSIGEKPMYTDLDLVYMKDTVLTKEIETLKNIMTEAIQ